MPSVQGTEGIHIKLSDDPQSAAQMAAQLNEAVAYVRSAIDGDGVVYVHCAMGVSRSATVAIAYRMEVLGESLREVCWMAQHLSELRH